MAPQASLVTVSSALPVHASAFSSPTPAQAKPFIPVALLIFLGLCLANALSYLLYRVVMSRRRTSAEDAPESPDRGVTQFMNGARLTLNFAHNKSAPVPVDESPDMLDEEKPLTDASRQEHSEMPPSSPADSSSSPFIILMPSFGMHPDLDPDENRPQDPTPAPSSSILPPLSPDLDPPRQPFSQRVAAKVKFLSGARAHAITRDPKLAPVQGPLRPLSTVPSPPRRTRTTLFGLGFRHSRGDDGDPGTVLEAR